MESGRGEVATYIAKKANEPSQIMTSNALQIFFILLPAKYSEKLFRKLGGMELPELGHESGSRGPHHQPLSPLMRGGFDRISVLIKG